MVWIGNICRSPMGEAVMHHLATEQGVRDDWLIDSAGTGGHEAGSPIYPSAKKILTKYGIKYEHTARQVYLLLSTKYRRNFILIWFYCKIRTEDFDKFDLILGFDNDNIRNLERIKPKNAKAQIRLVNYYNEKTSKNKIIPDPWYEDTPKAFEEVYEDCHNACLGLLKSV